MLLHQQLANQLESVCWEDYVTPEKNDFDVKSKQQPQQHGPQQLNATQH
jgi:hypothetical protein